MKRNLLVLTACLASLVLAGNAHAQKKAEPTVEVRIQSVNDLLEKIEYIGGVLNQADALQQGVGFVKSLMDEKKGIEGIDPSKPIGLYTFLTPGVIDSQVVTFLPVADPETVLQALQNRAGITPKKGDDGVYSVQIPGSPLPVYFRFSDGYGQVTVGNPENISPKKMIKPSAFFSADQGTVIDVRVRLDRIPADLKKTGLAQLELKLGDAKNEKPKDSTPAQEKLRLFVIDQAAAIAKSVLMDGKEFALKVEILPKSDLLGFNLSLTGVDGSDLTKLLKSFDAHSSRAAAIPSVKNALAAGGIRLSLPESTRAALAPIVDDLIQEAVQNSKESDRQGAKIVFDALLPSLKSGVLEMGGAVVGPDDKKNVQLLSMIKVAEGLGIEKTVKQLAPFIPSEEATFAFDQGTASGINLHSVTMTGSGAKKMTEVFGTPTLNLGTSDAFVAAAAGVSDAQLKAYLAQQPQMVPLMTGQLSMTRLMALGEKTVSPGRQQELVKEIFGSDAINARDEVAFIIQGGEALTIGASIKGAGVKLAVMISEEKKK